MTNRRSFIKNISLNSAGILLAPAILSSKASAARLPGIGGAGPLPRSTPEQQGIASAALLDFLNAIDNSGQEFHSIMVIRHGYVVAQGWWTPFTKDDHQQLYEGET